MRPKPLLALGLPCDGHWPARTSPPHLSHSHPTGLRWVGVQKVGAGSTRGCPAPLLPLPSMAASPPAPHALCPCLPQPRAACPSRGSPVSHQLLMSILQAWDGGGRTAAHPHLAHQLPQAAGLWPHLPLGCALLCPRARGHRNVSPVGTRGLCASGAGRRGAVAQPSIPSRGWGKPQLRTCAWAAAATSMASQLPARLSGVPTAERTVREESPLPILFQLPGGGSILQPLPAQGPVPTPARRWHLLG